MKEKRKFRVTVRRDCTATSEFDVEAAGPGDAACQAVEQAANTEFGSGNAEYNVENIEEIK